MTDVTGFGLMGHLTELLGPTLGAILDLEAIPTLACLSEIPNRGADTLWTNGNIDYIARSHAIVNKPEHTRFAALLDPQTNGGILVSIPSDASALLTKAGFTVIGRVTDTPILEFR
jgi:selenide,water dikinase